METKYKLSLRIKGVEKVFAEGMGPGVIATQEVSFEEMGPMASASLLYAMDDFMKSEVEVIATPIVDASPTTP